MCLITTSTTTDFRNTFLATPGLLEDVYKSNPDGLGIMFASRGKVKVFKTLPKNAAEARAFLEAKLPSTECHVAIHWRWRTHGAIDLGQCHPYKVSGTTWLMHNGVLHTGNEADESKSDTWHFVKDYFDGLPDDTLHHNGYLRMVGEFIDNNRFAILSADGRLSVVNADQGIEHGGVWFSNTYAWTPALLIPDYGFRSRYQWPSQFDLTPDDEPEFDFDQATEDIDWFLQGCDPDGLATMFEDNPAEMAVLLRETYTIDKDPYVDFNDFSQAQAGILKAWLTASAADLAPVLREHPQLAAELLVFNCTVQPNYLTEQE